MRVALRTCFGVGTLAAALALAAVGCGGGGGGSSQDEAKTKKELAEIGYIYHNHNDGARGKAPAKVEDLAPYAADKKDGYAALQAGKYVFLWNVAMKDLMKVGTVNVVLAYEKDVPTKGGWVVMGDASVVKMTADEFNKSPKVVTPP